MLPAGGGEPIVPERHTAPAAGQPWGQPWGPEQQEERQRSGGGRSQYEPQDQRHGQQDQQYGQQPPPQPQYEPQQPQYESRQSPYEPQRHHEPLPPAPGPMPLPLPAEETQVLPPQSPAPPAPPSSDAEATQLMAPVAGGPLPPERPSESTTFLGRRTDGGPAPRPPGNADEQATQYIAPVPGGGPAPGRSPGPPPAAAPAPPAPGHEPYGVRPGSPGDRQPPAEFDGLFRDSRAADGPDATQQMPRFDQQSPPPPSRPQYGQQQFQQPPAPHEEQAPQGRAARRNAERKRPLSPAALAGIVIGGCVVAGLAAGAALSGGDDGSGEDDKKPVAASQSAGTEPPAAADPVKEQAEALDALLADSNNSREAVIKAVQNIGACKNLPQAASDLRDAAKQRNELVTRLGEISVDRLPEHASLTASLTSAWKASAAADNHYAAWADQVASGKGGCKGGKAKVTGQTAKGNTASGRATEAKKKAAALWNPIAKEHGLTERQYLQL
ncbi:hypothetical protein BEN35_27635 [Streptomyces fradiae]|nr:hypothetical protein BEN35_27635 [Streptomyces fradiae]